jgi:putative ABC transport system substrate-binding protein
MRRREAIGAIATAAVMPLPARGQSRERMPRIGVLYGGTPTDAQTQPNLHAFDQGLQGFGWMPGRNLTVEYRFGGGAPERMRILAKELVGLEPSLILGSTTQVVAALLQETRTIPIVFVQVSDPVGSGFVESLSRPGGNVSGFINIEASIAGKWIELLKEIVPGVTRAGMVFNPATAPYWNYYLEPFEAAARSHAIAVVEARVSSAADIEAFISSFAGPAGGLVLMPDVFVAVKANLELLIALTARHRLPAIYPFGFMTAAGGLISYGIDNADLWRRATAYVDQILKGAKPAALPVQLPTKFELTVNLKTAKALGLAIAPSLVLLADEVIE